MKKLLRFGAALALSTLLVTSQVFAVSSASLLPVGATQVAVTSGNVAAGVAAATIPAVSGRLNYISGFNITGTGATAGQAVVVTVTGLIGGTEIFTIASVTGVAVGNVPLIMNFNPAIQASAINTAIVVSCASLGAGSTNNVVNAYGWVE